MTLHFAGYITSVQNGHIIRTGTRVQGSGPVHRYKNPDLYTGTRIRTCTRVQGSGPVHRYKNPDLYTGIRIRTCTQVQESGPVHGYKDPDLYTGTRMWTCTRVQGSGPVHGYKDLACNCTVYAFTRISGSVLPFLKKIQLVLCTDAHMNLIHIAIGWIDVILNDAILILKLD